MVSSYYFTHLESKWKCSHSYKTYTSQVENQYPRNLHKIDRSCVNVESISSEYESVPTVVNGIENSNGIIIKT